MKRNILLSVLMLIIAGTLIGCSNGSKKSELALNDNELKEIVTILEDKFEEDADDENKYYLGDMWAENNALNIEIDIQQIPLPSRKFVEDLARDTATFVSQQAKGELNINVNMVTILDEDNIYKYGIASYSHDYGVVDFKEGDSVDKLN